MPFEHRGNNQVVSQCVWGQGNALHFQFSLAGWGVGEIETRHALSVLIWVVVWGTAP